MNNDINYYIKEDLTNKVREYESFMHYEIEKGLVVFTFVDSVDGCVERVKLQHYIERNYNLNVWTHDGFKNGKKLMVSQSFDDKKYSLIKMFIKNFIFYLLHNVDLHKCNDKDSCDVAMKKYLAVFMDEYVKN